MDRLFFILGALSGAISVATGAFGAHGLRARVTPDMLAVWETASRYQMYHAFGLIVTSWMASRWPSGAANAAGWLFVAGTVIFSGSLYVMTLTGIRALGAITPIGGVAFIAAWIVLAWAAGPQVGR
jgi:uncharacterized membrane protein YgdD (TMEM256/DUF423 family)